MTTRRQFMFSLSVAGLSAPFLSPAAGAAVSSSGQAFPEEKVLRVALLGLGSYAERVAEAMKDCKRARLAGLISGTPAKAGQWKKKYGIPDRNVYSYESFPQIRDNPDIDAVYVITPNSLHHRFVLAAAAAGKHVICEKPMADNARQAQEMIEACRKAGVKLLLGYRMHFEPHTREVIRMVQAGELGRIKFFEGLAGFKIGDPAQWRLRKKLAGGGSMMDIGIYALNAARYTTGEEPLWVSAQEVKTDPVKFAEVDETITFQLGFPSGAIASCLSTYNFNHLDKLFVVGEKGFAELQPAYGYGPIEGHTDRGPISQPVVTHQTLQLDGMAGIILDNAPMQPAVDGEEGLRDMQIIDAIYESIRKNGQQIRLR